VDLLVAYDVDTTTARGQMRLRQVARICEAYGHRVQKSVFEVVCSEAEKLRLVAAPHRVIDPNQDSVRLYRLTTRALDEVEHLGVPRQVEPRGPLVI
jgi:CRISPR-associated protein Cas2